MIYAGRNNKSCHRNIYFGALNGGEAKAKALPKVQGFLCTALADCKGSPKIKVFLGKINGNGCEFPLYESTPNNSFLSSVMQAKNPSRFFRLAN
ncbi:MAG: hypothetical protein PF549_03165 [Patescibacteria group bacterium]|jgi:hypothetical protein|nr:hypothetical protein [Patescibacteria group bacterium]